MNTKSLDIVEECERQRAELETKLKEAREELESSQRLAHVGSWGWIIRSDTVTWSREMYRIFGRDPDLPPPPFREHSHFFTPESFARLHAAVQEIMRIGMPFELELELVLPDGTRRWIVAHGEVRRDAGGHVAQVRGTIQDIKSKQAEEVQAALAAIVANSDDAIIGKTLDGTITSWNRGAERIFGYRADEAVGKNIMLIIPQEKQEEEQRILATLQRGEAVSHYETQRRTKEGRLIDVSITSSSPIRTKEGRIVGVSKIARDITGRKRAEEERERLIAELERSNKELEQFAYVSSHDLQEPLRMVGSYVQLLERKYKGKLDAQADKYIAYAVEGAVRMQKLIEGLLAYSRIGTRGADLSPVSMNEVFGSAVSNLAVAVRESHAAVTRDDLPVVAGDETQLVQLLQNLIGNALKFRKPGVPPAVHVSVRREKEEWVFSVTDNGIGIRPEHFDRIFQIFQRLHTRQEYPGTGIGLALCKRIVERHRGRIWVESTPGEGSTFSFTIPLQRGVGR